MNRKRFEREYGQEYQDKTPEEETIMNGIGRRIDGYELEADVYTIKLQRIANEYRNQLERCLE